MLVVILFLCGSITLSRACSCVPHDGPESYCWYDVIFRGRAMKEYSELHSTLAGDGNWVYTMQVDHALKIPEELKTGIILRTHMEDSMCGIRLPLDMEAIFFAYVNWEGEITTSVCDPNTLWESMSEEDQQYFTDGLMDDCAKISLGSSTLGTTTWVPPP